MCGIAGIVARPDRAVEDVRARLAAMSRAMRHRGPDDDGVELASAPDPGRCQVGFAHRRLAILDLSSAGHQPLMDPQTGSWIVHNGEIYNFRDLRSDLEREGSRFFTRTDTEVILKAYAKWGEACLDRLRGMFAFAIWDPRRRRLFLARDRLGVKPLYFWQDEGRLLFASEVRALLASGLVPRRLDPAGLAGFLSFGSVCDPATLIDRVQAVRPGHYLVWRLDRLDDVEYWDVGGVGSPPVEGPPPRRWTALGGMERVRILGEIRDALEEAVRLRLVSDVPVGIFLSGGIDSSTIVGLLARGAAKPPTFSVVFKEREFSEAEFSRMIAERFGTDHHEIVLSQRDALDMVPDALSAMDQPTIDGVNTYVVSGAVRAAGLKVALSGLGGDEVFAGYDTFRRVPRMERVARVARRVPEPVRRAAAKVVEWLAPEGDRGRKRVALIEGKDLAGSPYALSRMLFLPPQRERLLHGHAAPRGGDAAAALTEALRRASGLDLINRVSYLELRTYMANTLLRDTDAMSMAHGLEVRVPLIDHVLVERVFRLPGAWKVGTRTPKRLLVAATAGLLPDEVVHRRKMGFTLPFDRWLRDGFRGEVERALSTVADSGLAGVLDPDAVRGLWRDFEAGRLSWSRVWALYVLRRWCEQHL